MWEAAFPTVGFLKTVSGIKYGLTEGWVRGVPRSVNALGFFFLRVEWLWWKGIIVL